MAAIKFVPEHRLVELLQCVPGARKYVNVLTTEGSAWALLEEADPAAVAEGLRGARPFLSAKSLLLPAREVVATYGRERSDPLDALRNASYALIGARGCECRGLAYLDAVMLGEPMDEPFYRLRRENCTVVAVDCAAAAPSCFCNLLDAPAFAESGFDLNLAAVSGGFTVEAGSDVGEAVLASAGDLVVDASQEQLAGRLSQRRATAEGLAQQNADYGLPGDLVASIPATLGEALWLTELAECVQCGGCTAVCPTCYCFLLYDQEVAEGTYERVRAWDSCQFTGYSEMAGPPGTLKPDPRRDHMSKFQHRFAHKFWYNSITPGILGCVGCGRCRDTCPGGIDLRKVLSGVKAGQRSDG
jgi:sulfhydrogenase subunit beta (sulfur reductase)